MCFTYDKSNIWTFSVLVVLKRTTKRFGKSYSGILIFSTARESENWLRNRVVREIGNKIDSVRLKRGKQLSFGSSYREVRKIEDSRNWDSTVYHTLRDILLLVNLS